MNEAAQRISLEADGERRVVLTGEIDLSAVHSYLERNPVPTGIAAIEAAAVTFIDSAGLKFLIDLVSRSPEAILRRPSDRLLELLMLTGTSDLFTTEMRSPARRTSQS